MPDQTYNDEMKRLIGENIRELRISSRRSVIELSGAISMARGYWYEIERGEANVTIDSLQDIAALFGTSVRVLVSEPRKSRKEPVGARK